MQDVRREGERVSSGGRTRNINYAFNVAKMLNYVPERVDHSFRPLGHLQIFTHRGISYDTNNIHVFNI